MLPDLLRENLKVVFCGTAVGKRSSELTSYYAGKGNRFWRVLHTTGFTHRQLDPIEYPALLSFDIGLTDLVKFKVGADSSLGPQDFNIVRFREKILRNSPKFVCFNGKMAAMKYLGSSNVPYGLLDVKLGSTLLFVAPSTSGAANWCWDESVWQAMSELCHVGEVD